MYLRNQPSKHISFRTGSRDMIALFNLEQYYSQYCLLHTKSETHENVSIINILPIQDCGSWEPKMLESKSFINGIRPGASLE